MHAEVWSANIECRDCWEDLIWSILALDRTGGL